MRVGAQWDAWDSSRILGGKLKYTSSGRLPRCPRSADRSGCLLRMAVERDILLVPR